jgi:hypothetical protein
MAETVGPARRIGPGPGTRFPSPIEQRLETVIFIGLFRRDNDTRFRVRSPPKTMSKPSRPFSSTDTSG